MKPEGGGKQPVAFNGNRPEISGSAAGGFHCLAVERRIIAQVGMLGYFTSDTGALGITDTGSHLAFAENALYHSRVEGRNLPKAGQTAHTAVDAGLQQVSLFFCTMHGASAQQHCTGHNLDYRLQHSRFLLLLFVAPRMNPPQPQVYQPFG